MAETIIDAFLVTLGLDPSGLKKGSEESKGEMRALEEEAKKLQEKTKEQQKAFHEEVKASSAAVTAFQAKARDEALATALKLKELQHAAAEPGAGKKAAADVRAHLALQKHQAAEAAAHLKHLQEQAAGAQARFLEFQGKAKAESDALRAKMHEVEKKAEETAEKLKQEGEKGSEFFDKIKEHALEFFGVIGSGWALLSFAEGMVKARVELLHLSEQSNMAVEDLSQWQNAVKIAGGTAEGFNSSIKELGSSLVGIEKGLPRSERALKVFNAIGIKGLGKGKHVETTDVLEQLHAKFSSAKMSLQEAATLGARVGIHEEAMIRILHKGGEEYEEMMAKAKALGVTRREDAEAAEKVEEGINAMGIAVKKVVGIFAGMLIPVMGWAAEKMTALAQWAREHAPVMKAGVALIAAAFLPLAANAIAAGVAMVGSWVSGGIAALAASASFVVAGISAAAAWVAATGGLALLIPLVGILIGGLVRLYQKSETFREGVNKAFGWAWNYIQTVFLAVWDVIKHVFSTAGDIVNLFVGLFTWNGDRISNAWHALWEDAQALVHKVWMLILYVILTQVTAIVKLFGKLGTAGKALWSGFKDAAIAPFKWIEDKLGGILGMVGKVTGLFKKGATATAAAVVATTAPVQPSSPAEAVAQVATKKPLAKAQGTPFGSSRAAGASASPTSVGAPSISEQVAPSRPSDDEIAARVAAIFAKHNMTGRGAITDVMDAQKAAQRAAVKTSVTSTSTRETHIGQITVQTQAQDAQGIARDIGGAVRSTNLADHADGGMV